MTDIASQGMPLPSRLGVTARLEDGRLVLGLEPQPETLHHGVVRASVISYLVDVVAGVPLDNDPDFWTLTTDMTVRARPLPAPGQISTVGSVLRRGKRSATCLVELTSDGGEPYATGAIGFARIPRKEGDPPKPRVALEEFPDILRGPGTLTRPLRQEAGIEVVDAAGGTVQVELTSDLLNPAGTLQGAMVALVAEAAAEDLLEARPAPRWWSPTSTSGTSRRPTSDRCAPGAGCSAPGRSTPCRWSWSTSRPTRSPPWSTSGRSPSPDRWGRAEGRAGMRQCRNLAIESLATREGVRA